MDGLVKGSSAKFVSTVYLDDNGTLANVAGATIKLQIKKRDTDTDAQALLLKTGSITSAALSTMEVPITAAESLALGSYNEVVYEIIVKLADGSFIRSGVKKLQLLPQVLKTLF
jgi:hypothetical protein